MFTDTPVNKICWNTRDSFGEICVHCNCCSTDKKEKLESRIITINGWICEAQNEIDLSVSDDEKRAKIEKDIEQLNKQKQEYIQELRCIQSEEQRSQVEGTNISR